MGRHDRQPERERARVKDGEVGVGDQVRRGGILFDVIEILRYSIGIRRPGGKVTFMESDTMSLTKEEASQT